MGLQELAGRMDAAGDLLNEVGAMLERLDPGPLVFGGDGPGRLGDLGRTLHLGLASGLAARGREATAHGARFGDTAHALRLAAREYAETDRGARDRHTGEAG